VLLVQIGVKLIYIFLKIAVLGRLLKLWSFEKLKSNSLDKQLEHLHSANQHIFEGICA
jgi:hypothetical protein